MILSVSLNLTGCPRLFTFTPPQGTDNWVASSAKFSPSSEG